MEITNNQVKAIISAVKEMYQNKIEKNNLKNTDFYKAVGGLKAVEGIEFLFAEVMGEETEPVHKTEPKIIPFKAEEKSEPKEDKGYSGNKTTGSKYKETSELTAVEIAKLIRKESRAYAKKHGFKVSVKYDSYSMGCSIDTRITAIFTEGSIYSEGYKQHLITGMTESQAPYRDARYNDEWMKHLKELKRIHDQYNYNDCDSMTDYFDVRYYGDVSFDWELERWYRVAIEDTGRAAR